MKYIKFYENHERGIPFSEINFIEIELFVCQTKLSFGVDIALLAGKG